VLPSVNQFEKITLSFDGQENWDNLDDVNFIGDTVTVEIATAGSWEASIKAYIGEEDPEPAAVSSAAKTVSWAGSGQGVVVEGGDTRFLLVSAADGQPGKLRYAVTLPENDFTLGAGSRIRIEQEGAAVDLDIEGFTDGERAVTASIAATDLSLDAGFYVVDILIVKDDNTVAVYRKSVGILSGLITEIGFEAGDFLDPATAAAVVALGEEPFGPRIGVGSINFTAGSPSTLAISATGETMSFTLTKHADQTVGINQTGDWNDVTYIAEGEQQGDSTPTLAVFKVENIGNAESTKAFALVVTDPSATGSLVVNVTVTGGGTLPVLDFGLYSKIAVADETAYAPIAEASSLTTLDAMLKWLAVLGNLTADTNYLVLFDGDQTIAPWVSVKNPEKTGVEITLRGINLGTNGGENWKVTPSVTNTMTLQINSGTTLTLDDGVTLYGNNSSRTTSMVLTTVASGDLVDACFIMQGSSKITNVVSTSAGMVGVTKNAAALSQASFIMKGGEISANTGRSAIVQITGGNFTIEGGKITGNTLTYANNYAATNAIVNASGNFLLSDGEISDNVGRGVVFGVGDFAMTGGKITNNGKVVYTDSATQPEMAGLVGAGIYFSAGNASKAMTIAGGEITGNGLETSMGSAIAVKGLVHLSLSDSVAIEGGISLGENTFISLGGNFTNTYTNGDGGYVIPIILRSNASNAVSFATNWADGKNVLVCDNGLTQTLLDNFNLGGGCWHAYDDSLVSISIDGFSIKEDDYYGILKISVE
jgi:hypothetical protein